MSVNERQVGGTHYKSEYQHWDFVLDTHMNYLYGCATKYISRWRKKNGVQDLEKSIHYLQKAEVTGVGIFKTAKVLDKFRKFADANFEGGLDSEEGRIFLLIYDGENNLAINRIRHLIADEQNRVHTPD